MDSGPGKIFTARFSHVRLELPWGRTLRTTWSREVSVMSSRSSLSFRAECPPLPFRSTKYGYPFKATKFIQDPLAPAMLVLQNKSSKPAITDTSQNFLGSARMSVIWALWCQPEHLHLLIGVRQGEEGDSNHAEWWRIGPICLTAVELDKICLQQGYA